MTSEMKEFLATKPPKSELGEPGYNPHEHKCSKGHIWHHDPARMVYEMLGKGAMDPEINEALKRSHLCPVCGEEAHWTCKGEPSFLNDGLRVKPIDCKPNYAPDSPQVRRIREMIHRQMMEQRDR
jgi:hypothetical protein